MFGFMKVLLGRCLRGLTQAASGEIHHQTPHGAAVQLWGVLICHTEVSCTQGRRGWVGSVGTVGCRGVRGSMGTARGKAGLGAAPGSAGAEL